MNSGPSPQLDSTSREGAAFAEAAATARMLSTDALLACGDVLALDLADPDYGDAETDAVARELAAERQRAVARELERRERLSRTSVGIASPSDARYEAWRELAREVRRRSNVADILRAAGWPLERAGRDRRRGGWEWSGPCPLCGGSDRLRVFDGENGRAWCRQCLWSADAITAVQSLLPGCAEFRDAVRMLAEWVALTSEVPA